MSCGVGYRRSSDPELLWLWRRAGAKAPIRPLAGEPPYAEGAAKKIEKKKKKKKKKEIFPKYLLMFRKCEEGIRKEGQDWYLVGHMAGWEKGCGRNSLTVRTAGKHPFI